MKYLESVRTCKNKIPPSQKLIDTLLVLILGILLGIFSKWLDNLSINDAIWWQHILGVLDLRNIFSSFGIWILLAVIISIYSNTPLKAALNVFLFLAGMTLSYHWYTITFCGFNPKSYMLIWYTITLFSPVPAYMCWYAKGKGSIPLFIDILIISAMFLLSFGIDLWYFDFKSVIDTLLFIITVAVLYNSPRRSLFSLLGGILLAYILTPFR